MLVPLEISSAVLVMISIMSVPMCNRFHARRANSSKMTFYGGTLVWRPRSRGISSPSGTKICHKKTRVLAVAHSEDFMILSCVVLTQYSSVTDGRTDASGVAKTRLALSLHAVTRNKNCYKTTNNISWKMVKSHRTACHNKPTLQRELAW